MAEQSLLARLGVRLGTLGAAASLAFAAPLAEGDESVTAATAASRIGFYVDRTAAAEKIGVVVMALEVLTIGATGVSSGRGAGAVGTEAFGTNAGNPTMTCVDSTFVGNGAGASIVDGLRCTAVGSGALTTLTNRVDSTAVGFDALRTCNGPNNTAVGSRAADSVTSGARHTAVGSSALAAVTSEDECTAIGFNALLLCTVTGNTAVGAFAGDAITSGINNTIVGHNALGLNETGANNTAVGFNALAICTDGNNTALGSGAGPNTVNGINNVFLGINAGDSTAANAQSRLVVGGNFTAVTKVFVGNGETNTAPASVVYNATGGNGDDVAGANLTLAAGRSTGTGLGGNVIIQGTPAAGGTSAVLNTLETICTFLPTGLVTRTAGGVQGVVSSKAADHTVTVADHFLIYTDTLDTFTLPLANVAGAGISVQVVVKNAGTGVLTVARAGADTIFTSVGAQVTAAVAIGNRLPSGRMASMCGTAAEPRRPIGA